MNEEQIHKIRKKLKGQLSRHRFLHTEGVAYTAVCLAMCHRADLEQAMLAGLLHDCAKYVPDSQMMDLCYQYGVAVTPYEQQALWLLHAKAGAILAKVSYGIDDREILSAIRYHTTGRPNMTLLEKIIFIADYIEPHRKPLPNLENIRAQAYANLDDAVYEITKDTLEYLRSQNSPIDKTTFDTYDFYKKENLNDGNTI